MSDVTIFKLSDISISSYSKIQIKAKKNSQSSSFSNAIIKINAPVISISNTDLYINSVPYATGYIIYVDNSEIETISNTTYDLSSYNSPITVKVKATNGEETSAFSNILTPKLETPTISLSDDYLSWNSIQNATSYNIYANNVLKANTSNANFDLSSLQLEDGSYLITVKAIDEDYFYEDSDTSNSVVYSVNVQPEDYCLVFSSPSSFTLQVTKNISVIPWNGTMEYSIDGTNWLTWDDKSLVISSGIDNKILVRGVGNNVCSVTATLLGVVGIFTLTGSNILCLGNIETLLDYQTVALGQHPTMSAGCFTGLFLGCTSLISAPDLPATNLTPACYQNMFGNCTSLTTPAVMAGGTTQATPAKQCCVNMYKGCTSLNIYTSSSGHTPFYKAITYSTSGSATNYQSSYQMFYNCYVNGTQSTADYLTAGTQYYY